MTYKFYSGPQGTVTVTELAGGGEITIARVLNADLKGRWYLDVLASPRPARDVTAIIHDHTALAALIDERRA